MSRDREIHRKYVVTRTDGSSGPGGKHEDCAYFVLDLECDAFAIPALKAYAKACRKEQPALASDIDHIIESAVIPCGCREAACPHSLSQSWQGESQAAHRLMNRSDRRRPK